MSVKYEQPDGEGWSGISCVVFAPQSRVERSNVISGTTSFPSKPANTSGVTTPLVQGIARNFEQALRLMEAALTDCPDSLWEKDLWPDEAPTAPTSYGGLHGSAPWFLVYHSLLTLDYDLVAEFELWEPPQPFDENTYAFPSRVFTKAELLVYVDYCRARTLRTLDDLFEAKADRPLPDAHRYRGTLYGVMVGSIPLHVIEHASQIRQFLTSEGVKVQSMPGDRGYVQ
jgi:DinB superfamily